MIYFLAARLFWLGCTDSFYTNAITYILVIPYVILYSFEDINCEAISLCFCVETLKYKNVCVELR